MTTSINRLQSIRESLPHLATDDDRRWLVAEIDRLREENIRTIEILTDMILQSCTSPIDDEHLMSFYTSSFADGLRFLAKQGIVEITDDQGGRRVIAKLKQVKP